MQNESTVNGSVQVDIQNVRLIHRDDTNTKAYMSAVIGGSYAVHGIKVVASEKGDFVAMPSVKMGSGGYKEMVHPITAEARSDLYGAVMDAYRNEMAQKQNGDGQNGAQEEGGQDTAQEEGDAEETPEPEEGPSMTM